MTRRTSPKEMRFIIEQVKAAPGVAEQRINDAFDILFEETLKFVQSQRPNKSNQKLPLLVNFKGQ